MIVHYCFLISISFITAIGLMLWWHLGNTPSKQRHLYLDQSHQTPVGMLDFVVAFMIWLGVPSLIVGVLAATWQVTDFTLLDADQTNVIMFSMAVAQLLGCAAIVCLGIIRYGVIDWLFASKMPYHRQIILAAKTFCMVVPIVWGVQALLSLIVPYEHETLEQLSENFSVWTMLSTWLGAVGAAPLCEELIFRGVLQSWLHRICAPKHERDSISEFTGGWSLVTGQKDIDTKPAPIEVRRLFWWMPIMISSAVFALIHVGQGAAPIPLFLFAIGLGFVFRYTGSLIPCIALHFMLNAFTMFWLTLQLMFPLKDAL